MITTKFDFGLMTDKELLENYITIRSDSISYKQYRLRDKECNKRFPSFSFKDWIFITKQSCLSVKLNRNNVDIEETIRVLSIADNIIALQVIEGLEELDLCKYYGIFEHTLSEYAIIFFLHTYNDKWVLCSCRYHKTSIIQEFDSLESILRYIMKHHYYD